MNGPAPDGHRATHDGQLGACRKRRGRRRSHSHDDALERLRAAVGDDHRTQGANQFQRDMISNDPLWRERRLPTTSAAGRRPSRPIRKTRDERPRRRKGPTPPSVFAAAVGLPGRSGVRHDACADGRRAAQPRREEAPLGELRPSVRHRLPAVQERRHLTTDRPDTACRPPRLLPRAEAVAARRGRCRAPRLLPPAVAVAACRLPRPLLPAEAITERRCRLPLPLPLAEAVAACRCRCRLQSAVAACRAPSPRAEVVAACRGRRRVLRSLPLAVAACRARLPRAEAVAAC